MSRFASFREFYPFYLSEHRHPVSRRLHFIGSCGVLLLVAAAILRGQPSSCWPPCSAVTASPGSAISFREEPPGDLPAPAVLVHGRLGDVRRHPARARALVAPL
jgi:hypothetical protein